MVPVVVTAAVAAPVGAVALGAVTCQLRARRAARFDTVDAAYAGRFAVGAQPTAVSGGAWALDVFSTPDLVDLVAATNGALDDAATVSEPMRRQLRRLRRSTVQRVRVSEGRHHAELVFDDTTALEIHSTPRVVRWLTTLAGETSMRVRRVRVGDGHPVVELATGLGTTHLPAHQVTLRV